MNFFFWCSACTHRLAVKQQRSWSWLSMVLTWLQTDRPPKMHEARGWQHGASSYWLAIENLQDHRPETNQSPRMAPNPCWKHLRKISSPEAERRETPCMSWSSSDHQERSWRHWSSYWMRRESSRKSHWWFKESWSNLTHRQSLEPTET